MTRARISFLSVLAGILGTTSLRGAGESDLASIDKDFIATVRPLIEQYCLGCHSTEKHKGDLDLERFAALGDVMKQPKVWQAVVEQLTLKQMPPKPKAQPRPEDRERLLGWVNAALDEVAKAHAGDPGPVVLRRLDNAEYTYTVRDLTGVATLDPVKEFPADSAAGEGFMNTGNSLVMSPALIAKYLDAGKNIAGHAVLLPDGFRFASGTSRRDWTEEILVQIRELYRQFTDARGADRVNLQGIVFDTNEGGRLPVEMYLRATLELRAVPEPTTEQLRRIAGERGLSAKYLESLWRMLHASEPSLLLDGLRARWRDAKPDAAAALAGEITRWQGALWKFSSVGHIGKVGGPKAWMEPVSPLATKQELRLKLTAPPDGHAVAFSLVVDDAGDGNANDFAVWDQPRLVVPGRPELPLRDARDFIREMTAWRARVVAATAQCLEAAADAAAGNDLEPAALARRHGVDADALAAWLDYLGIGTRAAIQVDHLTQPIHNVSSYDFVNGWGTNETPSLFANSADQHVRIPGNMKPHGVAMHPSPQSRAAAGWRSPLAGTVCVEAAVTHAHADCGNGVEWFLQLRRGNTRQQLAHGFTQGGEEVKVGPFDNVSVQGGDLVSLLIGPRDQNHFCDLTDVELVIRSAGESAHEWSLTRDVSPDVLAGNPHADRLGNAGVWHFYAEPTTTEAVIPAGSCLANWLSAASVAERLKFAREVQELLTSGPKGAKDSPDAVLRGQLFAFGGPLFALPSSSAAGSASPRRAGGGDEGPRDADAAAWSIAPALFGKHPNGTAIDPASLCVQAPSVIDIRLPADLFADAELVTGASLHEATGAEGSVQVEVTIPKPERSAALRAGEAKVTEANGPWTSSNRQISNSAPILVNEASAARKRIEAGFDDFRQWFPAALCYVKIVPVDEAVTLTLFHREDQHLARLMLDEAQTIRLDRLWDQLHYISQDALTLVDAFEQIWQFATQDADPKVFEPLRQPINERAAAFRQRIIDTQPKHVDALLDFAALAYRRPLTDSESQDLRTLYRRLRDQEIPHEEAFRLTLARVFVAPAFLYRLEQAVPGVDPGPVTDWELASRLSYFLWSSAPDAELREAAASGTLHEPDVLSRQAIRMLRDARVRRLATEFGCAWLHIYAFDELDEKSERHFPTFGNLRGAMYEEAIRFFTDVFQSDASVLALFDADHTFVNDALAGHYGIPGVTGPEWRRVDGVRRLGRGGILGLSATLAKQSGASRTSPILRGNWVSEVLLGDKLPRPPKDVPRLPDDESTESLTQRQLVEKHTSDPRCSGCHVRIDGYGFALEGYDAIGRLRTKDLGERPIDTRTTLPDGTPVDGADDLRHYLLTQKRDAVLWQFSRKLLGYALGRGVALSDKPLLTEIQQELREHEYRFSSVVETIVRSKQFREIRGRDAAADD